jgi:hypothetical protein
MAATTYFIYCAYFEGVPQLGYFVGYSKYKWVSRMITCVKFNAINAKNTKMSKAMAEHEQHFKLQVIEVFEGTSKDVVKRVFDISKFYNTVECGLNEPWRVKKDKRICEFCGAILGARSSLSRHKKQFHKEIIANKQIDQQNQQNQPKTPAAPNPLSV